MLPDAAAVVQDWPSSKDTRTVSPVPRGPVRVPLTDCEGVLVIRSLLESPVSDEKTTVAPVTVGAAVSMTMLALAPSEPAAPGVASVRTTAA